MRNWFQRKRVGPIGVDLGSRALKLVQLSADGASLVDAVRWDLPLEAAPMAANDRSRQVEALRQAREGRKFCGRSAVLCLGWRELFVQNVRLPKAASGDIEHLVRQESESKLPFPAAEADLRWWEAAEVRQGDAPRREMIVVACHRPVLEQALQVIEQAGLQPVAVDIEPLALLRAYSAQFRRDVDQQQRVAYVHIGQTNSSVLIAQGTHAVFMKYLELGGRHFDEAVSRHLQMDPDEAWALRRHNGDRRADQQDPEVARSVAESVRPVVEKLAAEVSLCIRYHNVTFRGQALKRLVLGGGEASPALLEVFGSRLDMKCELGDPWRTFEPVAIPGRRCQWDVAVGLALRPVFRASNTSLVASG